MQCLLPTGHAGKARALSQMEKGEAHRVSGLVSVIIKRRKSFTMAEYEIYTIKYAAVTCPVKSASPSRVARI